MAPARSRARSYPQNPVMAPKIEATLSPATLYRHRTYGINEVFVDFASQAAAFFDLDKTIRAAHRPWPSPALKPASSQKRLAKGAIAQNYYQMFGADHTSQTDAKGDCPRLTTVGIEPRSKRSSMNVEEVVASGLGEAASNHRSASAGRSQGCRDLLVALRRGALCLWRMIGRHFTRPEVVRGRPYTGGPISTPMGPQSRSHARVALREDIPLPDSFSYSTPSPI